MKEMLSLTPCDLFQLVEGRTLWLVGDSMTQVRLCLPIPASLC